MANEVSTTPDRSRVKNFLKSEAVQKSIKETLGAKSQQFTTSLLSLVGSDALLAQAEPGSLFTAALTAAALDLPINKNLGFAFIIGYRNNRKNIVEAQFQVGAKGLKQLAMRTGQYKYINDSDVREGELIKRDRLTGEIEFVWEEDDAKREKLPIIGYVSFFELHNGFRSTVYMSTEQIKSHAEKYSQSYKSGYGPWKDNFLAMCLKTVTKKNISNNGPMSTELQKAVTFDQGVVKDDGSVDYVDGELANVGADDDKKAAIIAANQEDNDTTESDNAPVTDEELDNLEASDNQATLIEQPKADSYGDNPQRRTTGKR